MAASQLTLQEQQNCCRLFLKVDILTGLSGPPRLSYLKIPVETLTGPFDFIGVYIITNFLKKVNNKTKFVCLKCTQINSFFVTKVNLLLLTNVL